MKNISRKTAVAMFFSILAPAALLLMMSASVAAQTVDCSFVVGWTPNTSYAVGNRVTFSDGNEYKALQAHTSQTDWMPPNVPALWQKLGACSTPPPATTNCAGDPAWSSSATYTRGNLVTFNGSEYSANLSFPSNPSWSPTGAPTLWAPLGTCEAVINSPPFDFSDNFYGDNGIDVTQLDTADGARFGFFRQTGPPAGPGQINWVTDNSNTDPNRKNVRILATTGGYPDDGSGSPTEFISIIAFLTNQNFFLPAAQSGGTGNARGIAMQDIVSNFEAYAALKQRLSNGTFALTPCGTMGTGATPCFPVTSVATPNLRQDWRFATNRNAIDGSDNNLFNGSGNSAIVVNNSPFGYFCDDLLGMWIITYFWFTVDPANPGPTCGPILSALDQKNGVSLDGTPIILTADELNNDLEANGCGAEGKEDVGGADGGAVWLICPAIPDPRAGGITHDAFIDVVHNPDGTPLDPRLTANFVCLQNTGQYCNGQ